MSAKRFLYVVLLVDGAVIAVALSVGSLTGHPTRWFHEGQPVTFFSAFQLLFIAWMSLGIFRIYGEPFTLRPWKAPRNLWAIVAAGFFLLALDELAQIHEHLDKLVHWFWGIRESALSDRLDDLILVSAGLVAVGVLYGFRDELKKYAGVWPFFFVGFALFFAMTVFDFVNERWDILKFAASDPSIRKPLRMTLDVVEESVKILGEGVFLAGFYYCRQIAKSRLKVASHRRDGVEIALSQNVSGAAETERLVPSHRG